MPVRIGVFVHFLQDLLDGDATGQLVTVTVGREDVRYEVLGASVGNAGIGKWVGRFYRNAVNLYHGTGGVVIDFGVLVDELQQFVLVSVHLGFFDLMVRNVILAGWRCDEQSTLFDGFRLLTLLVFGVGGLFVSGIERTQERFLVFVFVTFVIKWIFV